MTKPNMHPDTIAAQANGAIDEATGAIVPPVHVATTFLRDPDNQYTKGYLYGRPDNGTVRLCEDVIAGLEGAAAAHVSASGMTAATTAFLALERPAHVIAPTIMYWALRAWLQDDAPSLGITATFIDTTNLSAIEKAIKPGQTRMIWLETPANPLWHVSDIAAVAKIAKKAGALLAVDSTVATPILTRPIALGADVVMHAATKYLNGHSDVVAGALAFARKDAFFTRAERVRKMLGGILGPFEASLLLRGMRTLPVRMAHQSRSAMAVAQALLRHPLVLDVLYPGLEKHPGHAIAARQMTGGFSGMLSVRIKPSNGLSGEAAAIRAAARVKIWKRATSLGGVESLIEHRASIEGPTSPCPPDLLRLSVGLEHVDDLINDLTQAIN
jgi:cystathionine gamma-synthase